MKNFKKGLFLVLAIFFFASFYAVPTEAKEPINVPMVSAPFGTGQYVLSTALEDISKKHHSWLRLSVTESPGLVYNIKKLETDSDFKKTTITICDDTMLWFAREGKPPLKKPMGKDIRILAYSHGPAVWFVTLDPKIKSIKDLDKKKVAIGTKAQITWGIFANWMLDIGWEMKGKVDYQWVGLESSRRALLDGLVDATPVGVYLNTVDYKNILNPQTRELFAARKKINHLSIGEEALKRMSEALDHEFKPVIIPAGKVPGIDEEIVAAWGGGNFWAASEQFPEELAYEFVKLLIDNCGKLKDYHVLGTLTESPAVLCEGADPTDLHPGAYRAYKEAGLMK